VNRSKSGLVSEPLEAAFACKQPQLIQALVCLLTNLRLSRPREGRPPR
jgi:hypothetical protein